jgi:hypothetical protein
MGQLENSTNVVLREILNGCYDEMVPTPSIRKEM